VLGLIVILEYSLENKSIHPYTFMNIPEYLNESRCSEKNTGTTFQSQK